MQKGPENESCIYSKPSSSNKRFTAPHGELILRNNKLSLVMVGTPSMSFSWVQECPQPRPQHLPELRRPWLQPPPHRVCTTSKARNRVTHLNRPDQEAPCKNYVITKL